MSEIQNSESNSSVVMGIFRLPKSVSGTSFVVEEDSLNKNEFLISEASKLSENTYEIHPDTRIKGLVQIQKRGVNVGEIPTSIENYTYDGTVGRNLEPSWDSSSVAYTDVDHGLESFMQALENVKRLIIERGMNGQLDDWLKGLPNLKNNREQQVKRNELIALLGSQLKKGKLEQPFIFPFNNVFPNLRTDDRALRIPINKLVNFDLIETLIF